MRSGRAAVREFGSDGQCVVLAGISLGALVAGAVAAREPVAGLALLLAGGELTELAGQLPEVDERYPGLSVEQLTPRDRERIDALEPLRVAPALRPEEILFLDAWFDGVVPRESSELLWQHLGRPQRVTYPVGHFSFALALPWALEAVADHAEKVCAARE